MKTSEILKIDAQRNKGGISFQKNVKIFESMLVDGAQFLKENDTLFGFISHKDRSVEIHTFNAAPANTYINNIKKFLEMLRKIGAKEAWTEFDNPKLVDVLFEKLKPEFDFKITKNKRYMAKVALS